MPGISLADTVLRNIPGGYVTQHLITLRMIKIVYITCFFSLAGSLYSLAATTDPFKSFNLLNARLQEMCEAGMYSEALPIAETTTWYSVSLFGNYSSNTAFLSHLLATLYYCNERYADAIHIFTNTITVFKYLGLTNTPTYAECLNNVGEAYRILGAYAQAESSHVASLRLRRAAYPSNNSPVIHSLNNLGEVYRLEGKYQRAEEAFLEGIRLAAVNSSNVALESVLRNNLAFLLRETGRYGEAEIQYRCILDMLTNSTAGLQEESAAVFNDLAILEHDKGAFYTAKDLYLEALTLYTNSTGLTSRHAAGVYKNIGGLYTSQALYSDAESCYYKAYTIYTNLFGPDHIRCAGLLNDLAVLYRIKGDYQAAELFYDNILGIRLAVLGSDHPTVGHTYNNMARLFSYQNKYEKATRYFSLALQVLTHAFGTNHPDIAVCYNNLGEVDYAAKLYSSALIHHQTAYLLFTNFFGTNHLQVASVLHNIGNSFMQMTNYISAESAYMRSLSIRKDFLGVSHPLTVETMQQLARLYSLMGRHFDAVNYYENALNNYENASLYAGGELYSHRFRAYQRTLCSEYLDLLHCLLTNGIYDAETVCEKFLYATELARSRGLLDQLLNSSARFSCGLPDEAVTAEENLRYQIRALNEQIDHYLLLPDSPNKKEVVSALTLNRSRILFQYKELLQTFTVRYPRFMELRQPTPVSIHDLTTAILHSNEMMVSYWVGDTRLYACLLSSQGNRFYSYPATKENIAGRVAAYRSVLESYEPFSGVPEYKLAAYGLYKVLLEPCRPFIDASNCDVLYFVSHDVLAQIPFEPLICSLDGSSFRDLEYLFNSYSCMYIPSARALAMIRSDIKSGRYSRTGLPSGCFFGDPLYTVSQAQQATEIRGIKQSYDLNSGVKDAIHSIQSHMPEKKLVTRIFGINQNDLALIVPLPSTRKEVESISELLQKNHYSVNSLLGPDANETILKKLSISNELHNARFVHFATHGILPGYISGITEPCLVLSIYGDSQNDGFLKMSEIFGLKLQADMVTLSACQTGAIDKDSRSEGLSGFAQAFFYAGTPRLTVALWNIEDKSTYQLMTKFYANILNPYDSSHYISALNNAKKSLLHSRKFTHPFFWSSFIILGEWNM